MTNKNDLVFQLMQVLAEQKTVVEGIAEGEPIPETTKTKVGQALLSLAKHLKDIENAISPLRNEDENGLAKVGAHDHVSCSKLILPDHGSD